jgi:MinD superfamily P-loop ATPase
MKICIASGKGGTGKTALAVALAKTLEAPVALYDCDVEAPDCHLFLNESAVEKHQAVQKIPLINADKCTACGACAEFCQFNAILALANTPAQLIPELCHACGGCRLVCPSGAITETTRELGEIRKSDFEKDKKLYTGTLKTGNPMAPALINQLLAIPSNAPYILIDAPPGTSCPFMAATRYADYIILVSEPTPFALNDLRMALETINLIGIPTGVVINKSMHSQNLISDYCQNHNIPVLLQIPYSQRAAELNSQGISITHGIDDLERQLRIMIADISLTIRSHH